MLIYPHFLLPVFRALLYFLEQKRDLVVDDVDYQLSQGGIIVSVKERLGDANSLEDVLEGGASQSPLGQHFQPYHQQILPYLLSLFLGIALF